MLNIFSFFSLQRIKPQHLCRSLWSTSVCRFCKTQEDVKIWKVGSMIPAIREKCLTLSSSCCTTTAILESMHLPLRWNRTNLNKKYIFHPKKIQRHFEKTFTETWILPRPGKLKLRNEMFPQQLSALPCTEGNGLLWWSFLENQWAGYWRL